MRTGTLVAVLTASGIAGGIVGGLLVQGGSSPAAPHPGSPASSPAEPDPRDAALEKEVASLRARLDEMQASVGNAATESGRLRTELEKQKKAGSEARARLAGLEAGGMPTGPLPVSFEGGRAFAVGQLRGTVVGMDGQGLPERVKRAFELRQKPEEDRWAATREALGLSGGQEEDLKAAIKERDQAVKDTVKVTGDLTGADGTGNTSITISTSDTDKVREARKAYDDKVSSTLTADQAKKWREDGYEDAFRGGGPLVITSTSFRNGPAGNGEAGK
jgi:hypothetical protein